MKINLTGRHVKVTDALREYLISKLEGLERFYDRIISIDVNLDAEKGRQIVGIVAYLPKRKILRVNAESNDMHTTIDSAVDKLKRQLQKYKEKLSEWRIPPPTPSSEEGGRSDTHSRPQIIHTEVLVRKPMTAEEAALQLDSYHRDFLIFVNAETGQLSIIHRLDDGSYELLEPRY